MSDKHLRIFLVYRLIRWFVVKLFGIVRFILTAIFFAWIGQAPASSKRDEKERTADDIWDTHPKHYYDKEPPAPFS